MTSFLMSESIKSQVLKTLNYGFGLFSSNLLLKVRYKTLGEVQRGFSNDLQTGSQAQETENLSKWDRKEIGYLNSMWETKGKTKEPKSKSRKI